VGIRIREAYGQGVVYVEDAVVHHTLFAYRGRFRWLLFRSFWQGFSKRVMEVLLENPNGQETDYLLKLVFEVGPDRIIDLLRRPSRAKAMQPLVICVLTVTVGLGYLYGLISHRNIVE
jgi:hypothetical protein